MMRAIHVALGMCVVLLLLCLPAFAQDAKTPAEICAGAVPAKEPKARQFEKPEQVLKPGVDYQAIFCTDAGPIYVDLFEDITPVTVNSFVFLAQQGFYNDTTFHRVIANFMAQGGDPTGTGTGSPGYQFKDEIVPFLTFDVPGWLAMANSGPNTNGSQFFITTAPAKHLDYHYTIFGTVLEGQTKVDAIRLRDPQTDTKPGTGLQTVVIITDPATVKTTYQPPDPATQSEVETAMDSIQSKIPPDSGILLDKDTTGTFSTDQVVAGVPEALRDDYSALLTKHHHQYRVSSTLTNGKCDLTNVFYTSLRYTIDAFDNRWDAAAVLNDPFFTNLPLKTGFSEKIASDNLQYPMYGVRETVCNVDSIHAVTHWLRGRYLVTSEATLPSSSENMPYIDIVLRDFVGGQIYEVLLSNVLLKETRQG